MTDRTNLVRRRGIIKGQLTIFAKYVQEWTPAVGLRNLTLRLNKAEEFWGAFQEVQCSIESLEGDETARNADLSEREAFQTLYFDAVSRAYDLIEAEQPPVTPSRVTDQVRQQDVVQSRISLPKLQIPSFSGETTEWTSFKDIFNVLIDQNISLSPVQKLWYLKGAVKGSAAQLIRSLPLNNDSYQVALSLLTERYENRYLIVQQNVKLLVDFPKLNSESAKALRGLIDNSIKHIESLRALSIPVDEWDAILIYILKSKLDVTTLRAWELIKHDELPTYKDFIDFLTSRVHMLDNLVQRKGDEVKRSSSMLHKGRKFDSRPPKQTSAFVASKLSCLYCMGEHKLHKCSRFNKLDVKARRQFVKRQKLCYQCLGNNHYVRSCKASACSKCNGRHNILLHLQTNKPVISEQNTGDEPIIVQVNTVQEQHVLLNTSVVLVADKHGELVKVRCLLDMAAQSNLITSNMSKRLGLPVKQVNVPVIGLNEKVTQTFHKMELDLYSCVSSYERKLECLVVPNIASHIPSTRLKVDTFKIPRQVHLADDNYYVPGEIDMLLNNEVFWDILCNNEIKLTPQGPTLRETKLGYIVVGSLPAVSNAPPQSICQLSTTSNVNSPESLLQRFWELESITTPLFEIPDNVICERLFKESVSRVEGGRYQVSLPFKTHSNQLGNSEVQARKRFFSLENKFIRHPEFKMQYVNFMTEYESLQHMTKVKDDVSNRNVYYIPHHGVINENSTTTKLRVVYDCSAQTDTGISLNDILYTGPVVQPELFATLLKFRIHPYVIQGDIEKMYRQVLISPNDRPLQRILWRPDRSKPLQIYQLNTVTYGMTCSSYLATRVLKQLVQDEGYQFPMAASVVVNNTYVDDILYSGPSEEEVINLRKQLTELLSLGGFHVRKWKSNSLTVLDTVPSEDRDANMMHMFSEEMYTKTLGLYWQPYSDFFSFHIADYDNPLTKRIMVSEMAMIYDPLGLISPLIVRAKVLVQQAWKNDITWDDPVAGELSCKWIQLRADLQMINQVRIPRQITINNFVKIELHAFSDATPQAYGSCIYLKSTDMVGHSKVQLVASKSKVAPIKAITIPRLELCAAVLSVQLMHKVTTALNLKIDNHMYWSDSSIVLSWIRKPKEKLDVFIRNRVAVIQDKCHSSQWRHVISAKNPADLISRGESSTKLLESNLWWNGPDFLLQPATEEFSMDENQEDIQEEQPTIIQHHQVITSNILHRYSSLMLLLHVVAYCLRFIRNARLQTKIGGKLLLLEEIDLAWITITKLIQTEAFQVERSLLRKGKPLHKNSKLLSLNPFLDENDVLRVGGRLQHSDLTFNEKHPIILPANHHVTKLIVKYEHAKNLHLGYVGLHYLIRRTFWIINARQVIKAVLRSCLICFKVRPRTPQQLMGNLPKDRVSSQRPFSICGIDFCGPVYVKQGGRSTKLIKAYIAVFVCFIVKAVHLELVSDLTTDSFIAALKRFVARRGKCSCIYSDNARNFVGASKELAALREIFLSAPQNSKLHNELISEGIEWKFTPPYSPHFGGLYESYVKLVKYHLKRVLMKTSLTWEQYATLLTQVEACINSRPITAMSEDMNDVTALTPGHFLIGEPLLGVPEPSYLHIPANRLSNWQAVQERTQRFWKRWQQDYLGSLQQRTKWKSKIQNLEIGSLVLVKEPNSPPYQWMLGRVVETHPGTDGLVRVVTLKTARGQILRAIDQICPLNSEI